MAQYIEKMEKKRKSIIEAGLSLFTQKGFYNTSTAQIAKVAGIASGTLFIYFATKEELIDQIYVECLNDVTNYNKEFPEISNSPRETIYLLTKHYVEWSLDNNEKFFYICLYNNSLYRKPNLVEGFYQSTSFINAYEEGMKNSVFKNMPIDFMVHFWTKSINGAVEYCISHKNNINQEYLDKVIDFMLGCIIIS